MGTEIKIWQIVNGQLSPIYTALRTEGRTEPNDLEPWICFSTRDCSIGPSHYSSTSDNTIRANR